MSTSRVRRSNSRKLRLQQVTAKRFRPSEERPTLMAVMMTTQTQEVTSQKDKKLSGKRKRSKLFSNDNHLVDEKTESREEKEAKK